MTRNKKTLVLTKAPSKIITEEDKRPDHSDYATSSELRSREYSGLRLNSITDKMELWILGVLKEEIDCEKGVPNYHQLNRAYEVHFGISLHEMDALQ